MFNALQPVVYVQVSPESLSLKNLKSGQFLAEEPELAVSAPPNSTILAVGLEARAAAASNGARLVNPFAHPRSLVSDFTAAEQLIKHQLRRILGKSWLSVAPYVVIHPLGNPEGGFTQVELRAFREMVLGAGAAEAHVWTGRPLSDGEVLSRNPPTGAGTWE
jgi:rod shape-determining protein MreB and related proteins